MSEKKDRDLVDIQKINPHILVEMRYATPNNFTGRTLYNRAKCYLRRSVASKLDAVQKKLEKVGLGLKVYDGYRPLSVQKVFWEFMPDDRYVAPPEIGSRHNRGAAVDLTLVDKEGRELIMPTPFDDFSVKAHRNFNELPKVVIYNRCLLENIMADHGFIPCPSEWWHFDAADWENYPLEDIALEALE